MRYLGRITITAAILGFGLALGAAPQLAEAGRACNKLGLSSPCIKRTDIMNGQVRGNHVQNGSLTASDLKNESGADFLEGPVTFDLTGGHDLVSTVRVTAPTAGTVIASASGVIGPYPHNIVECSITTGAVAGGPSSIFLWSNAAGALDLMAVPFAGTRGFQVGPGTTDINLVCRDASGNANIFRVQMTAMFFPSRY
ncbi:MAG: hypothetical protein OEM59_09105 [Rhodospirillales bacterium]|nr:hypothetical protein [Rhodospirillales bacterium]